MRFLAGNKFPDYEFFKNDSVSTESFLLLRKIPPSVYFGLIYKRLYFNVSKPILHPSRLVRHVL